MLFFLILSIVKSKITLEDPIPTPNAYPLSVSTRLMTISGEQKCMQHGVIGKDPDCPVVNFDSPSTYKCGQTCWSDNGKATFSYTFKGVQFLVYGNKTSQYKRFDLYFDGSKLATIDEQTKEGEEDQDFALLYTSKVYKYGEHTITAQGIEGNSFSIYKFAFWPHLKAKRLNISEMESTGKWKLESDEIGGTREYSDKDLGASKSLMIEASKLWVYGTPDPNHGKLRISFDAIDSIVNTYQAKREDGKLLFESGEIPTTFHQLDLVAVEAKSILIYCVYYLYDPPERTPMAFPSRTPVPGSNNDYIDKEFIKKNVLQISDAKQISGCTFSDITSKREQGGGSFVYFIKYDQEGLFYDNRIEFSSSSSSNPGPLFLTNKFKNGKFTISQCTFVNCMSSDGDGNVVNCRADIALYIEESRFVNCYAESPSKDNQAIIRFNQANVGSVKFTDCIFQFSLDTKACPALYGLAPDVTFERCTFSKCGAAILSDNVKKFIFTDNTVTYSAQQVISIIKLQDRPTITGNSFRFNKLNNSNLITLIHTTDQIEIINNTFDGNSLVGSGQTIEGGGSGLKVQGSSESFLYINDCHFVDNKNDYTTTDTNSNQGGALYLSLQQTIELTIQRCDFKSNSAKGKGGALAVSASKDVSIRGCTFEGNSATQGGNVMLINIEKIGNEEPKLFVNKCHFINNGQVGSLSMIEGSCVDMTFDENEIKFSDKSKSCSAFLLTTKGTIVLSNTNFTNCTTSKASCVSFEGQNDASVITVSNCHFTNCKASSYTVHLSGGPAEVESCSFTFDSNAASTSCGAVESTSKAISVKHCTFIKTYALGSIKYGQSSTNAGSVTVSNCIFDDCAGGNRRCFNLDECYTKDIKLENNVIKNMKASGNNGYFGVINCKDQIDTFVMTNVTFIDNNCNSEYGGGTGLWIVGVKKITFNDCKFINNVASSSNRGKKPFGYKEYTSGDGGAVQYGFSNSLYEISLNFNKCQFSRNKAVRHGGALGLQTFGTVEIIECIFEENVANYQLPSSSNLLEEEKYNYFNMKTEGRGGAIYINPTFYLKDSDSSRSRFTKSVNIEHCTFKSNSAFDGFAIYIEGNDYGTTFTIKDNTFTNNYDGTSNSKNRGVIVSEIDNLCLNELDPTNTFTHPNGIKIFPIICVDHSARTPEPTPMPTLVNLTFPDQDQATDNCNPGCYYSNDKKIESQAFINVNYRPFTDINNDEKSGGAIYLENYGLSLIQCSFTNCQTTKHGGGAIFINNELELRNLVNIENVEFKKCKASYGGAVYIRSLSEECPITITHCKFEENEILQSQSEDGKGLIGGSAVYLNAIQGTITNCTFNRNVGKGGAMKIINEFQSKTVKSTSLFGTFNTKNSFVVSDCIFNIIDNEKDSSAIFYHTGKFGSIFKVNNCELRGKLGKNSRYIDGKKVSIDAQLLKLKNCRFDGDVMSALNIKADFVSLNLNDLVFNGEQMKSKTVNVVALTAMALMTIVVVIAIVVALIVLKSARSGHNSNDIDEDNEVFDDSFGNL